VDIQVTETLVVGLMLVAALVAIAVNRLRLPYTVALVVVGLALGFAGVFTEINLTSDLILLVFLPPLRFEGAINMDLDDLIMRWKQVGVLAFVGTLISAAFIAVPLYYVPGMSMELAVVLAVILAPTDPVSVLAVFKEHGVGSGLRTLMEGGRSLQRRPGDRSVSDRGRGRLRRRDGHDPEWYRRVRHRGGRRRRRRRARRLRGPPAHGDFR
jgi:NhaP-type Na+/H+ or K+/H+ antiporter